jgi:F-type H+-transporting ATPase subunit epsilon
MQLEIHVADAMMVQARISALRAADASGQFGLRPGHQPFLTVLVPCVLTYRTVNGREAYVAVDGGVLELETDRVTVVTRDAVRAERLAEVADAAAAMLATRQATERTARAAFAELEASLLRELSRVEREREQR